MTNNEIASYLLDDFARAVTDADSAELARVARLLGAAGMAHVLRAA